MHATTITPPSGRRILKTLDEKSFLLIQSCHFIPNVHPTAIPRDPAGIQASEMTLANKIGKAEVTYPDATRIFMKNAHENRMPDETRTFHPLLTASLNGSADAAVFMDHLDLFITTDKKKYPSELLKFDETLSGRKKDLS